MSYPTPEFRTPPHNLEAEQALLGAILVNNEALSRVNEFLLPAHFFEPLHQRIYTHVVKLIERQQIANPVTLAPFFAQDPAMIDIGGPSYLARLAANAVTVINAGDYGRAIYDLALKRDLIQIGEDIVNGAYEPDIDTTAEDLIEQAEARLAATVEAGGGGKGEARPFSDIIENTTSEAAEARKNGGTIGLPTGLPDLDQKLGGGLAPGNLVILGGRPAMGKSAAGFSIAANVAGLGVPVGAFSLEMRGEEIGQRLAADAADLEYSSIRSGTMTDDEWQRFWLARRDLARLPLYVDDAAGLSIDQIKARARRMRRRHGIGLLIVDHLHLVKGKGRDRLAELTQISAGLKEIARDLSIPVLALCQLNRGVEGRDDKRPALSDLRESGSIEQDADSVMFIFRPSYYLEKIEPQRKPGESDHSLMDRIAAWHSECEAQRHVVEFVIAKNRHGPTGISKAWCDLSRSRFRSLAHDQGRP